MACLRYQNLSLQEYKHSTGISTLLHEAIQRLGLSCHLYADDTQLYPMLPADLRNCKQVPGGNFGMDATNQLKLTSNKMKVLLVGGRFAQEIAMSPILDGVALSFKEQVHSLRCCWINR